MNLHQTPEEIIASATAEQRILWNNVFLRYGEKIGLSQLQYNGTFVGSEFLVYSANKLYLCLNLWVSTSLDVSKVGSSSTNLYDELNVVMFTLQNTAAHWDTTAAAVKFNSLTTHISNIIFSRLEPVNYSMLSFIGYRLTI